MATITRENIAPLNDKLIVKVVKEDYLPAFEKSLKKYAKNANIQGFRKGMVPSGLIKKMYGAGIFNEEVVRTVDNEINKYIQDNKLAILAQPIPVETTPVTLDVAQPADYSFEFEIGLQPEVAVDIKGIHVKRYNIEITDKMLDEEIEKLTSRFGEYTSPETIDNEDNVISLEIPLGGDEEKGSTVLNLKDTEAAAHDEFKGKKVGDKVTVQLDKAFSGDILDRVLRDAKLEKESSANQITFTITKIGLLIKATVNEEFFAKVYPQKEIKTVEEFRTALKDDLAAYFGQQASSQIHDQIYHHFVDHTQLPMPEDFLKRWIVISSEGKKTPVQADEEYPQFAQQLQWALISSKLSNDNNIQVSVDEIKDYARQQLMGYLGGQMGITGNESWVEGYLEKMLADRKFVDDAHNQIRISKLFTALEPQVTATEESISEEAFGKIIEEHHHH